MLVLADHGCADDDDPVFHGGADLPGALGGCGRWAGPRLCTVGVSAGGPVGTIRIARWCGLAVFDAAPRAAKRRRSVHWEDAEVERCCAPDRPTRPASREANSRRSHGFGEWGGRRNARKPSENNPVSASAETGDRLRSSSGSLYASILKIGSGIGEHDIESNSSCPGIHGARRSNGPIWVETMAGGVRPDRAGIATHRRWRRTPPVRSGRRGARVRRSSSVRS